MKTEDSQVGNQTGLKGVVNIMDKAVSNKKPPCSECKRYRRYSDVWGDVSHICDSKRINGVTGKTILHECWWYRHSPFCKFESKDVS